ncbi:MAG: flagellar assembly protein FliW [Nitrospirae bacterium]|nr:flagellar assembly protein FliW [Nitrospirota bacterium]
MRVNTARFGTLNIEDDRIISFPKGIEGLSSLKRFFLIGFENRILWLHSIDDPNLAFMATDPFIFFPDYSFSLTDAAEALLKIENVKDICVLTFLSFNKNTNIVEANLKEPVIINANGKKGTKIEVANKPYTTAVPLPLSSQDNFRMANGFKDVFVKVIHRPPTTP